MVRKGWVIYSNLPIIYLFTDLSPPILRHTTWRRKGRRGRRPLRVGGERTLRNSDDVYRNRYVYTRFRNVYSVQVRKGTLPSVTYDTLYLMPPLQGEPLGGKPTFQQPIIPPRDFPRGWRDAQIRPAQTIHVAQIPAAYTPLAP